MSRRSATNGQGEVILLFAAECGYGFLAEESGQSCPNGVPWSAIKLDGAPSLTWECWHRKTGLGRGAGQGGAFRRRRMGSKIGHDAFWAIAFSFLQAF